MEIGECCRILLINNYEACLKDITLAKKYTILTLSSLFPKEVPVDKYIDNEMNREYKIFPFITTGCQLKFLHSDTGLKYSFYTQMYNHMFNDITEDCIIWNLYILVKNGNYEKYRITMASILKLPQYIVDKYYKKYETKHFKAVIRGKDKLIIVKDIITNLIDKEINVNDMFRPIYHDDGLVYIEPSDYFEIEDNIILQSKNNSLIYNINSQSKDYLLEKIGDHEFMFKIPPNTRNMLLTIKNNEMNFLFS